MQKVEIIKADLSLPDHQHAVVSMMDAYATDPMGDGKALADQVRVDLIPGLRNHPTTVIFLAQQAETPIGIAVCFRGFSTFAAKPLLYISDFYVVPAMRGHGSGRLLLQSVEQEARETDCCKLMLEVQENNQRARSIYHSFGFSPQVHVEEAGRALCMSKPLAAKQTNFTTRE